MRIQQSLALLRTPSQRLKLACTPAPTALSLAPCPSTTPRRSLAQIRTERDLPEIWFKSSPPLVSCLSKTGPEFNGGVPPIDERTLKLGKTLQILQTRLPSLLASPLPPDILSPHITLHLFPTTHPHLPTVSGRVAYHAALWTAPMAWGRVPIVGNVKLIILSERVVPSSSSSSGGIPFPLNHNENSRRHQKGNERLIVRWKTCGKTKGPKKGMGALYRGIGARGKQVDKITEWLGGDARDDEEFCGMFVFEFDEEGRVLSHTIEHVEGDCEGKFGLGGKVVSVTEWLLGRMNGKKGKREPALALGFEGARREQLRRGDGT